jgi:hypothetical protein
MARRISGVGWLFTSLRKSITMALPRWEDEDKPWLFGGAESVAAALRPHESGPSFDGGEDSG